MLKAGLGLSEEQVNGSRKGEPDPSLGGHTPRYLMQTLGTEWGRRMISDDIWLRAWVKALGGHRNVVVDDVRFPNEAELIRSLGGYIIQIDRPNGPTIDHSDHPSEQGLSQITPDAILVNDCDVEHICFMLGFILSEFGDLEQKKKSSRHAQDGWGGMGFRNDGRSSLPTMRTMLEQFSKDIDKL